MSSFSPCLLNETVTWFKDRNRSRPIHTTRTYYGNTALMGLLSQRESLFFQWLDNIQSLSWVNRIVRTGRSQFISIEITYQLLGFTRKSKDFPVSESLSRFQDSADLYLNISAEGLIVCDFSLIYYCNLVNTSFWKYENLFKNYSLKKNMYEQECEMNFTNGFFINLPASDSGAIR